jgi:hypothetical protein
VPKSANLESFKSLIEAFRRASCLPYPKDGEKKKWASNFISGLGKGTSMALYNISLGVSGVVTEPYKGAKKSGFKGGTVGMGKGLIGLIGKPIKGVYYFMAQPLVGLGKTPGYIKKKLKRKKFEVRENDTNF